MKIFNIIVEGSVARCSGRDGVLVCDNNDYKVKFTFDSEWSAHSEKTARFIWGGAYQDVKFTGDECAVPLVSGVEELHVGAYVGELKTTTSAVIPCLPSVKGETTTGQPDQVRQYRDEAAAAADRAAKEAVEAATEYLADAGVVQNTGDSESAVMSQKAVSSFYEVGTNRLNPDTLSAGVYMATDGSIYSNDAYNLSDYIPVTAGEILTLQGFTADGAGAIAMARFTAFDSNKNVLTDSSAVNVNSYTVPEGVAYIRVSYAPSAGWVGGVMIVASATVIPYEPYTFTLKAKHTNYEPAHEYARAYTDEKMANLVIDEEVNALYEKLFDDSNKNYLDISTQKAGLLHTNDSVYAGGSYDAYVYFEQYIPVAKDDVLSLQYTLNGLRIWNVTETNSDKKLYFMRIVAYDAEKNVLSNLGASANNGYCYTYTVPAEVSFVRITLLAANMTNFTDMALVKNATEVTPYLAFGVEGNRLKPDILPDVATVPLEKCVFAAKENLFDSETVVSGYVWGGKVFENAAYITTDYIAVKPNTPYSFYTKLYQSQPYFCCEYDNTKTFIKNTRDSSTITTGANTSYIRVSFYTNTGHTTIVEGADPYPTAMNGWGILEELIIKDKALVFLPDEIVCAVGRTIEVYNSQVCPHASKYHFRWECNIGKALKRKFSITATSALIGEYPLTLELFDDDLKLVYTKTATVKVVNNNRPAAAKTICPIGDSLTNGKYWMNEVRNLSGNKISFVGTRGNTVGLKHEGRSGFTAGSYLSSASYTFEGEGVHPFWDNTNGKFSWAYYKTKTGISPDAIQIFLGTNDLAGGVSIDTFAENVKSMVDSIRASDASIPIFVVLTICWGNQNGVGSQTSSDGFASQKGRFKYDLDVTTIKGARKLYDTLKSYTNLYFVPLTQCHDSEYNFGAVETPVNPRATQTELMPTEAVHPQQQGYEQMADIMYSVYCSVFS